jgi:hypothetical protein
MMYTSSTPTLTLYSSIDNGDFPEDVWIILPLPPVFSICDVLTSSSCYQTHTTHNDEITTAENETRFDDYSLVQCQLANPGYPIQPHHTLHKALSI